ncbi:MAG: SDR family oxidoreductase [Pseudomonadota bacterium]
MNNSLKGKSAIVTGASRGIGKAIALKLGQLGASVAVNYANNGNLAKEVVSEITSMGAQAIPVQADLRDVKKIEYLFNETIKAFGALDILVNNAGVMINTRIEEVSEEEFDNVFALNIKGVFFACHYAAKKMSDGGRIVNISTSVTKLMFPAYGTYAASKGAVEQLTKVAAKELGPRRITVNAISPGPTDTELFRKGKTEEQINNFKNMTALGRLGTPADIANAVAFIVSEEAGWISGQNICANGGFVA